MIRLANPFDLPELVRMVKAYQLVSPVECLQVSTAYDYVEQIITQILAGRGVIFVSEADQNLTGMLIAVKNTNVWDPSIKVMNELAYWVDPEHRGSTAGYRLLAAYQKYCAELVEDKQIKFYTISKMVNSPDLKYERFGFKKLEEMWRSEECQQV
jgi:predicted GNAT family N-acyltransferase